MQSWSTIESTLVSTLFSLLVMRKYSKDNPRKLKKAYIPCCSLRPIDIEFMRRLHQKVNLIPVIAKSDTMTDDEITMFKARVLADIAHHQIQIFHAPVYDNEDEETMAENEEIVVSVQRRKGRKDLS